MTTIWFLIILSVGGTGGRAFEKIPFQDEQACKSAKSEVLRAFEVRDIFLAICVPDRTQKQGG